MGLLVGLAVGWLGGYYQSEQQTKRFIRRQRQFEQAANEWAGQVNEWRTTQDSQIEYLSDQLLQLQRALDMEREQRVFYQVKAAHLDGCVEKLEKLQKLYDELKLSTNAAHARIRKINGGDK